MHWIARTGVGGIAIYLVGSGVVGAWLAEGAVRGGRNPMPPDARAQGMSVAARTRTRLDDLRIVTPDGVELSAWVFLQPRAARGSVIAMHGVGGTRSHVLGYAEILAGAGYSVLLPDARGHGESGGAASYGVREASDVRHWVAWLVEHGRGPCVFGVGSSMGAAHLLQALPETPQLCAVVADSSFSTFREAALDRLERAVGAGRPGRAAVRPALELGLLYVWLRDGVWLGASSPIDALAQTRTPVLLVHGALDASTPSTHALALSAARPGTPLWMVPRAGHTGAWSAAGAEYPRRVLAFLDAHGAPSSPR